MGIRFLGFGILLILIGQSLSFAQYNPFEESSSYKKYKYTFIDANFKKLKEEALKKNDIQNLQNKIISSLSEESDPLTQAEKWIQIGILATKQKQFHTASFFFLHAAEKNIGNKVGEFALSELSKLLLNNYHLEDEFLVSFFNVNYFDGMHPEVQSMSNYYRARYFQKKEFKGWAKNYIKTISKKSPWYYRIKLKSLLYDILEGGEEFPFDKIRVFYKENENNIGELDKDKLYLISARFLFEQAEFEKAFSVYQNIKPYTARLKGQILLEMAWSKHYAQDYSHALGLLKLLEAPYFDLSLSTERYLLETLIYRELCHYSEIKGIESKFNSKFDSALKAIKKRFGHSSNLILANMSLMNEDLAYLSQSVIDLRTELKAFSQFKKQLPKIFSKMRSRLLNLENSLEQKVEKVMPEIMNHLLIAKQEMGYLGYISKLDSMRTKSGEKVYQAEKIEKYKFDKLFWRTNGEFWLDELDDFRVLVNSRCGEDEA